MIKNKIAFFLTLMLSVIFIFPSVLWAQNNTLNASIQKQLSDLEKQVGGRLGVVLFDTGNASRIVYRGNERFPMCSTTKVMVVATLLKKSESDKTLLNQVIRYGSGELVNYNPITEKHVGTGMTLAELSAAALQYSDNTATNLIIQYLGGRDAVMQFARAMGDTRYRLDRLEPQLNTALPGDPRDTTTPLAMAQSLQKLIFGQVLAPEKRVQLIEWLKGNTTGNPSLRAGLPASWGVGDKTGGGDYGTTNDITVIWPPKQAPLILVTYFTQFQKDAPLRRDVLAQVARIVTQK